ncbi:uncharacterized protein PWA37_002189 [Arxiozyma heterogenica]|uniref:uncharacterized protein n=1 Tax=Arxiozyma heterogenica TaxID=278026 RepID=UPI002F2455A7
MLNIFDKDFAPLRISSRDVDPRDIIKDSRINHEQMLKAKKIPLVVSKYQDIIIERSNSEKVQSLINNSSNIDTENSGQSKPYDTKTKDNHLSTLSIEEQYLLKMIQEELKAKVFFSGSMWCNKQNQLNIKLSSHLIPVVTKIYNYLTALIELNNPALINGNYLLNLIKPCNTTIHMGEIGLYYSIQKLKELYTDYSFIIINIKDRSSIMLQQILYQVISQIDEIDPNLIEKIESGTIYSNFIKLLINLIEYSNFKLHRKSLLIFIDKSGCLIDIFNNCLNDTKSWNRTIKIGYIRLSSNESDGLVNIFCDSYPSNEGEYFQEVIYNLTIRPCNKNEFVDIFNTTIVEEIGKQEDGLANLLTNTIRSNYKNNASSLDCYQNIVKTLIISSKLSHSNISSTINSTPDVL